MRTINQGEGGEQGDALMPLLFSLGQHPGLEATHRQLRVNEKLFAYLDDVYIASKPNRAGAVYTSLEENLYGHAHIRIHMGKTHMWNQLGVEPPVCAALQRAAEVVNPRARVWRGSGLPTHEQGIRVLGAPVGHPDFVRSHLQKTAGEHQTLLEMIPLLPDVQSAWMMLLHCASARANYHLRVIRPELALQFATTHDQHLWGCLCQILGMSTSAAHATAKASATLPLALGGLGLRSAVRTSHSAYWASWADCVPMIARRHPVVAAQMIRSMELGPTIPSLLSLGDAARTILDMGGYEVPSWPALVDGVRPPPRDPENNEPGSSRSGWQHEAAFRVEQQFREQQLLLVLSESERALLRSQSGPGAGSFLTVPPTNPLVRFDSQIFRVLLLRRLRLPLPCPGVSADVAVSLTNLAIIVQLALKQGFLGGGGSLWKVWLPACAVKVVPESQPTCLCVTWTWMCPMQPETAVVWKSWLMDCPCLEASNWPLTPHWCLLSTAMVQRGEVQATVMGLFWKPPDVGKNGPTQNSFTAATTGLVWWYWRQRWGAGGLMKRGASLELWPGLEPDLNPGCCATELNRLGVCDGGHCSPALPHGHLPPLCWSFGALVVRMETCPTRST